MNSLEDIFAGAQGGLRSYGTIVERYQDLAVGNAFSILKDFHLGQGAVAPAKNRDSEAIYARLEEKGRPDMARQAQNGRIADSHFDLERSR